MKPFIVAVLFLLWPAVPAMAQSSADISAPRIADTDIDQPITSSIDFERVITYQGILRDGDGDPVDDGNYQIVFRIYDRASGGVPIWTGPINAVGTIDGLFSVELGPVALAFDTTYYLSLQIESDLEMSARQRLSMAPYSASADTASFAFTAGNTRFADRSDTSTFSYIASTASHAIGATRADTAYNAFQADTSDFAHHARWADSTALALMADHADTAAFAVDAGHAAESDTADYSDIAGFAIHSDTAIYAWISLGYSHWSGVDSALYTNGYWGLAKGGAGNSLIGDSAQTMINLGVTCTTGTVGQNQIGITISGGMKNRARKNYSTIAGGYTNIAGGEKSAVAGGSANSALGDAGFIGGGEYNDALGNYSTVGGGYDNVARNLYSTVGGGQWNSATENFSFIGGGYDNDAADVAATVGGGFVNHAVNDYATIGGGTENTASGAYSVISGGWANSAGGLGGFVGGGQADSTSGDYSSALSGYSNIAGDGFSDTAACVAGGYNNTASAKYAVIAGGSTNIGSGSWSVIGGGWDNEATSLETVIGGGNQNAAGGATSTISGGQGNITTGQYTAICGGASNVAGGEGSIIGGGAFNTTGSDHAFVGGGWENHATGSHSSITGGSYNYAVGATSAVGGGQRNTANGNSAVISGGMNNVAGGEYSAITGGFADTITSAANYSMAFGRGVYVNNLYRVMFFDGVISGRLGINRDDRETGVAYPLQIGTSVTNGNGAYLTAGGNWTNTSSRELKENFTPFEGGELLRKISSLSVTTWNYRQSAERHIGPVAEDFVGAFDVGAIREFDGQRDDKALSASDVAGVALAGVQELIRKIEILELRNDELEKRVTELESAR